ncbi:MAG TPA: rRNA methyltransferase [Chromatiales bacterium]|nr:rRNA methyltransferase [Chromatiales bacterium]
MRTRNTDPAPAGSFRDGAERWRTQTVVCARDHRQRWRAERLAASLGLETAAAPETDRFTLLVGGPHLELRAPAAWGLRPLVCDFERGEAGYRLAAGRAHHTLLARALGRRRTGMRAVDATAGLGTDGLSLATLGYEVTLLERHPLIACLLQDGLERAARGRLAPLLARVDLIQADAIAWLPRQPRFDLVYLDPMFPGQQKEALPGRAMQMLQYLVGADDDAGRLLEAALDHGAGRVVVKRPRRAPPLAGRRPALTFTGKSTRFDVYLGDPMPGPRGQ